MGLAPKVELAHYEVQRLDPLIDASSAGVVALPIAGGLD